MKCEVGGGGGWVGGHKLFGAPELLSKLLARRSVVLLTVQAILTEYNDQMT